MRVQLNKLFSQRDPNWSYKTLGQGEETIGRSGCLDTALAMVAVYFGKDENPDKMNTELKVTQSFDGSNYKWGGFHKIYGDIVETMTLTPNPLTDTQVQEIKTSLDQGFPVIVSLNCGQYHHYVVLTDYDLNNENSWLIANPWTGNIEYIQPYYSQVADSFRIIVDQYALYHGPTISQTVSDPRDKEIESLKNEVVRLHNEIDTKLAEADSNCQLKLAAYREKIKTDLGRWLQEYNA